MAIKITATQFEALVQAAETPKPIPLDKDAGLKVMNPMLFPHDWSLECSIETVWQTDVTSSVDLHQDRWTLLSRPLRRMTARLLGSNKGEAYAILQSLQAGTSQFGFPVPIFSDQTEIKQVLQLVGVLFRIYGDFARKRYFRGGRVVFLPREVDPLQSASSATFASIIEVSPEVLTVTFDQATPRTPEKSDTVFPCMDAETLESASGVAVTDSVFSVENTWVEVEGESSLPASWPAVSAGDSSVLSPFCDIVGSYALFPFPIDWTEGVDITPRRSIESNPLGRTSVQDPAGDPFLEFSISVQGYDRKSSWDVIRFFDAMRGRAGLFVLKHPMDPWVFVNSGIGLARIRGSANPTSLFSSTRKALVTMDDGTRELVTVSVIVEQPEGLFLIGWNDVLDRPVVEIQPAYICRFDSDSLVESWATDTVIPNMQLQIVEDPQAGAGVGMSGGSLVYSPGTTTLASLGGLHLLLRAGSQCFDADGGAIKAFPNYNSRVNIWKHSGPESWDDGLQGLKKVEEGSALGLRNRLVMPLPSRDNNGQSYIMNPTFNMTYLLDSSIPARNRQPWSTVEGWTCFFCITPYVMLNTQRLMALMEIASPESSMTLAIDSPIASGLARGRLIWDNGARAEPFIYSAAGGVHPVVIALRMGGSNEGHSARVWMNGEPCIPSGVVIPLADASTFTTARLFNGFDDQTPLTPADMVAKWGLIGGANLVAMYSRRLSVEEMNSVTDSLGDLYNLPHKTITLY